MEFSTTRLDRVKPLWDRMLTHRFLLETRDGTIPFETFATWMRQDYLFVEAAIPFIAALLAKAPREHWALHSGVIGMLQKELELFRERAEATGVEMDDIEPSFTNHAYIQFLLTTAYRESYAGGYTVLYAAEKAYHDSWSVVKAGIAPDSPWTPFVENWAGADFGAYVAQLEEDLNALAHGAGAAERERMAELFELTTKYEIAFWEMAATGEDWPGIDPPAGTGVGENGTAAVAAGGASGATSGGEAATSGAPDEAAGPAPGAAPASSDVEEA